MARRKGEVDVWRSLTPSATTVARVTRATRRHARKATPEQRMAAAQAYLRGEGLLRDIAASIGVSEGRMSQIVTEYRATQRAVPMAAARDEAGGAGGG